MKYIISESRLHQFINDYLDSFVERNNVSRPDPFIVISEPSQNDVDTTWEDYMEYDFTDGRLWINRDFVTNISNLFFKDKDDALKFVVDWFEDKFDVEVEFVQS